MASAPAGFRLTIDLLKQVDQFAKEWSKTAGFKISRTDAVKHLLAIGLKHSILTKKGKP